MPATNPVDERVAWRTQLDQLAQDKEHGSKWLQLLYSSYLQRFLSDNNRIWSTGQLMIPLALAPITAIPALGVDPAIPRLVFLAIPSTTLIWLWLVIAENHRAFQENSQEWLGEIEKVLKVRKPGPDKKLGGALVKPGRIRQVRWWLGYGLTAFWILFVLVTWLAK